MKLYSTKLSPYASRARLAVYAKAADVEILPPPEGGLKSPEYLAISPMGKVPCLMTDEGAGLPESGIIVEYLEALYPERPLTPACPDKATRARLVARVGETYVMAPMQRLFGQLNPATADEAKVEEALQEIDRGLDSLELFLDAEGPYAVGPHLTLADCQLAPMLFFIRVLGSRFGRRDWIGERPRLKAYVRAIAGDEHVARVWGEMSEGLTHYQQTGQFI